MFPTSGTLCSHHKGCIVQSRKKKFKVNTELNAGVIFASSSVNTKAPLDPSGNNLTQVDVIRSWTHAEFVCPPTSLSTKVQHPIHIDNYIILVTKILGETVQT